ncbi:MAG: branched-chain amino acid ABC transporter substrate-binding protein [Deltaproteobacteria bacterium RIFOXYD12_FULL_57_12]|nr:MAG: branched-chain amino acid ABC transporter substrate-binding protein [Deltaproteobacteria bacterium RIFOXYD12_FULL_57_12]
MKRFVSTALAFALTLTMGVTALRAENIKVGAILAVTGGQSFLGAPEAKTLEMMVAEKNAAGGINGNKIDLLIKDSAGDPEKAISFAKQLIEEEKVFAIIGPSSSGETMKIKDIAEQGKTILLSCAAAEVIVNPVAKYVFKTPQKDSFAVQMIFKEMNKMKISKIAVVADNTGFGKAGKEQLEKIAPDFGIQILAGEVYDKAATDLSALVAKLMSDKEIQAVINWSVVPAQAIVAKNMRQAGWQVPLFQSHGFGNIKYAQAAGAAAEGIIFPAGRLLVADTLAANHPQKSLLAKYKKDYESKYQEDVSTFGGHAYDALAILVEGIRLAGPDREKVRDTIENLKGFAGTGGIFNFSPEDHNGLAIDAFEMLTVKDGKFVMYQ